MKRVLYSISICCMALLCSCVSQRKMSYLRDVDATSADTINKTYTPLKENYITQGDVLSIFVNALDMTAVQAYSLPVTNVQNLGSRTVTTGSGAGTLQGYWVDPDGYIDFPVLGKLRVEGMTTTALKDTLTLLISQSVKDPIVNVGFLNFTVTILGEVKNPGRHSVTDQGLTIFDALGLAGDMTIYGKRNNVLVSREVNGKMEFARLNLNDESIFASPYYHIRQNDVIYVEPNNARAISSQNIPLYLSMITTLGSMATVIVSVYTNSLTIQAVKGNK
jgi:Periplasmic protein involved in polysaccharide export